MDQNFYGSPDFIHVDDLTDFNAHPNLLNDYTFNVPSPDVVRLRRYGSKLSRFAPPISSGSPAGAYAPSAAVESLSPASVVTSSWADSSHYREYSETVLKFMSQILMEENIEEKPSMFYDPLCLQSTEKSFYDALGPKYPPPNQHQLVESPHDVFSVSSSDYGTNSNNNTDPQWLGDIVDYKSSFRQTTLPGEYVFHANSQSNDDSQFLVNSSNTLSNTGDGVELLAQNIFADTEFMLQFRRGLAEASKFLPSGTQLGIDLNSSMVQPQWKEDNHKVEKGQMKNSLDGSRGRKNHEREGIEMEGRSNKQSAIYVDTDEFSETFDKLLLSTDELHLLSCNGETPKNGALKPSQRIEQPQGVNGRGKSRAKKQGKTKDIVDLSNLLILCAQAVSTGDNRTANELLKQIRHHSSPYGDGGQRLAHFMANALDARLAGTGTETQIFYSSLTSNKMSAYEMLKSYNAVLSACPFKRISLFFTNKMIYRLSEKATSIHIIDFGVGYGFQWPILIQKLSKRPGGPPKLRITGIDCPLPGFRPTERIDETGRRLAKYCERFNVPFEYHSIASHKWETIEIEDLKIDRNEMLAVNCLYQFKNLLDETSEVETSPRNAVLNLIRRMNPNVFVHSVVNGAFNSPFFVTRFREVLFHYSALYDVLEVNIKQESQERLMFEREFYGREAMNAIACEGLQRFERPETYKQWHVRTSKAGFKPLPLDQELVNMFKSVTMAWYHKDFVLDQDNPWLLLGWKGRILFACSCWVPAKESCLRPGCF